MAVTGYSDSIRYQVFVSSTYLDLQEERQKVIMALLSSEAFPAGMELFPATDGDAWTLIEGVIRDSDYYLLVVGGKYGSIDSKDNLSFTEKEYDYAHAIGKPIMAFIHGTPDDLPKKKIELSEDKQKRLETFIAKVMAVHHINTWTTPQELVSNVFMSFNKITKSNPTAGWVRGDRAASADILSDLAKSQIRATELEAKLLETITAATVDTSNLLGGTDDVEINMWCTGKVIQLDGTTGKQRQEWVTVTTTWNRLFYAFGPDLITEKDEPSILSLLEAWAKFTFFKDIIKILAAKAEADDEIPDLTKFPLDFKVALAYNGQGNNQISRILLQFKALGFLVRSDVNSFGAAGSFWSLSSEGERHAVLFRSNTLVVGELQA